MEKTKKIKPMSCPICDGMYFSEPNKYNYDEEIEAYLNGEVYCRHCGWIYDLHQFENPDSHDGFNKLSLNEYKKEFKEKIKNNPNYDYFEENKPDPTPHKCPVCGESGSGEGDAVESLRSSVESLRSELSKRIESEQTFAAQCEELKDQVAKQSVEIENLKNVCDVQNNCNKKLEEELAQVKSGK